jgi:hypothetical protein
MMTALLPTPPGATTGLRSAFAVIACQRSGTHLLREILNSHPQLALLAEPFSPSPKPIYWTTYVRGLADDQYPPKLAADSMALLDQYIEVIHQDVDESPDWYGGEKSSSRFVGLDVKYNQLHCVRPLYFDLRSRPLLLDYFSKRRTPIIHLVRRNVLHAAISMIVANRRQVYHVYNEASTPTRCYIPTDELLDLMYWSQGERDEFLRLSTGLRIHICEYEDVVADLAKADSQGRFGRDATVLQGIAKFLGIDCHFQFEGRIRKVLERPYSETIENYHDVVKAVSKSEFSQLARTI